MFPATFITHRLGVLHAESPQGSAFLLLCNHYTFKSMKDNRKSMAVGHAGLCLRWRQFQLPGKLNDDD
jgi:hypothetical protein